MISMFSGASDIPIVNSVLNVQAHANYFHSEEYERRQAAWKRLLGKATTAALYNSAERFDRPKCHPNTRVAIMDELRSWITAKDEAHRSLMWLYGPAGAGKSAIAYTLAEKCAEVGQLLAAFIFRRTVRSCNTWHPLVPTIACQMATMIPETRPFLEKIVDEKPMVLDQSLDTQVVELILNPLLHVSDSGVFLDDKPFLIVIDGLDECEGDEVQSLIVKLSASLASHPRVPLRILMASRPELTIRTAFNGPSASGILSTIALDDNYQADDDIRLFLQDSFTSIKQNHTWRRYIPPEWPPSGVLDELVTKSSGTFIYASTVVRYIQSTRHRPTHRLEEILGLRPLRDGGDLPFAEIDLIYTHLLSTAPDIQLTLDILALFLFTNLRRLGLIDHMLQRDLGDTRICLSHLASVIDIEEHCYTARFFPILGEGDSVDRAARAAFCPCYASVLAGNEDHPQMGIQHSSLRDFLVDRSRSKGFFLDQAVYWNKFICDALEHYNDCAPEADDMPVNTMLQDPAISSIVSLSPELEQRLWKFSIVDFWDKHKWTRDYSFRSGVWARGDGQVGKMIVNGAGPDFTIQLILSLLKRVGATRLYDRHVYACAANLESALEQKGSSPFVILSLLWLAASRGIHESLFFQAQEAMACFAVGSFVDTGERVQLENKAIVLNEMGMSLSSWEDVIGSVVTSGRYALGGQHYALACLHLLEFAVRSDGRYRAWSPDRAIRELLTRASRTVNLGKYIRQVISDQKISAYFERDTVSAMEYFVEAGDRNRDWELTSMTCGCRAYFHEYGEL